MKRHVQVDAQRKNAICRTCKKVYEWNDHFKMINVVNHHTLTKQLMDDCPDCHSLKLPQTPAEQLDAEIERLVNTPTPALTDDDHWGTF